MDDYLSKNKVVDLLKSQHDIVTTTKTLNKLLPYMGLADKEKFSDADVEDIIKARAILEKYGNKDSGYLKVAEEFGVNPNTISLSKKPQPNTNNTNTTTKTSTSEESNSKSSHKGDFARGVRKRVRAEFYNIYEQVMDDFINSDEPYEMLVEIMDSKVEPWERRMDELEGRQMKYIEQTSNTLNITAQEVGGILLEGDDRDINDADFHNQDDNGDGGQQ